LDFICKGLKSAALIESGGGSVLFKLNDWLEAEGDGNDLRLKDPDKVGNGGFHEVDDNWLWSDRSIDLLTNLFGKKGVGKAFF
jgi:hypothetical protein